MQWQLWPRTYASTHDARRAKSAPAPRLSVLGSSRDSVHERASGADSLPCSACDTRASSSAADAADCGDRVGTIPHSTDTCVVSRASSHRPPLGGSCGAITEIGWRYARTGKNTQNPAKNNSETENVEENRRRKFTAFIPTSSHDYQNDAGMQTSSNGEDPARSLGKPQYQQSPRDAQAVAEPVMRDDDAAAPIPSDRRREATEFRVPAPTAPECRRSPTRRGNRIRR